MPLLLWDFDRTLAQRKGHWAGALLEALTHVHPGHQVSREALAPHLKGKFPWHNWYAPHPPATNADFWWTDLLPVFERAFILGAGLAPELATLAATRVRAHYLRADRWELLDNADTTLRELSGLGWTHVLLSNHVPELEQLLTELGLRPHFVRIFNSAYTGFQKPHSGAFRSVLKAFPQERSFVMIGDNLENDILGAEALGIPGILVHNTRLQTPYSCNSLDELPFALAELRRAQSASCSCKAC